MIKFSAHKCAIIAISHSTDIGRFALLYILQPSIYQEKVQEAVRRMRDEIWTYNFFGQDR